MKEAAACMVALFPELIWIGIVDVIMLKHPVIIDNSVAFKQEGVFWIVDHDIVQMIIRLGYKGPDLVHHHIHLQIIDASFAAGIRLSANIANKLIMLEVKQ